MSEFDSDHLAWERGMCGPGQCDVAPLIEAFAVCLCENQTPNESRPRAMTAMDLALVWRQPLSWSSESFGLAPAPLTAVSRLEPCEIA